MVNVSNMTRAELGVYLSSPSPIPPNPFTVLGFVLVIVVVVVALVIIKQEWDR